MLVYFWAHSGTRTCCKLQAAARRLQFRVRFDRGFPLNVRKLIVGDSTQRSPVLTHGSIPLKLSVDHEPVVRVPPHGDGVERSRHGVRISREPGRADLVGIKTIIR